MEDGSSGSVLVLTAYVVLALGFSFLCSVAEAVLLSLTPSYIEGMQGRQPRLATVLRRIKQDNVEQSLAAILTLNTIAHTVGAIGAGAEATLVFGSAWFGVFSAGMTLAILFLSEIVPKTIGAVYWAQIVRPTAYFVNALIFILYPIVFVSDLLTRFVSGGKRLHVYSRDEFLAMARMGEETGSLHRSESRIIRNLFRFATLTTEDIMTPRTVVSAIPEGATIAEAAASAMTTPFSRLPLYRANLDDITGFVLKADVLIAKANGRDDEPVAALRRNIHSVPESLVLQSLLDSLLEHRQHIALVVDEYGGMAGIVTLEDLLETLMGMEITDETDSVVDMRTLARKRWLQRAKALGIDENATGEGGGPPG